MIQWVKPILYFTSSVISLATLLMRRRHDKAWYVKDSDNHIIGVFDSYDKASRLGKPILISGSTVANRAYTIVMDPSFEVLEITETFSETKVPTTSQIRGYPEPEAITVEVTAQMPLHRVVAYAVSLMTEYLRLLSQNKSSTEFYAYGEIYGKMCYAVLPERPPIGTTKRKRYGISSVSFENARFEYER